jgi:ribosome-associated protein
VDTSLLYITSRVAIPFEELTFSASRSGGPGGQNVNKVSTRVTLWFDLDQSPSLSAEDKQRIKDALGGRIGKDGMLRVIVQQTRSQSANKELAIERFAALLRTALTPLAARKKTRATFASKLRRLEAKKRQGSIKRERSRSPSTED